MYCVSCKDCDYRTQRKEVLRMHRRRVHPDECEGQDGRKVTDQYHSDQGSITEVTTAVNANPKFNPIHNLGN